MFVVVVHSLDPEDAPTIGRIEGGRPPKQRRALEDRGATTVRRVDLRGFQVRHWVHEGMIFWAVSDLNDTELDQFVHALTP